MPGKPQFCDSLFRMILCAATVVLVIALTVIPAFAQNLVPPTARQAAASPAFASRLHASTSPASRKRRPSAPACSGRASPQGQVLYENGPLNGTYDAFTINFGYVVSNSFTLGSASTVGGFDFYTWSYPGDTPTNIDWSITAAENGGTVYGSGTGATLSNTVISTNDYDYQINLDTISGLNVTLPAGTYWVNLQNAVTSQGNPLYWDENDGVGCKSSGCPSQAYDTYDNGVGTIGSETFDITGSSTTTSTSPPPCNGLDSTLVYSFPGPPNGLPQSVTIDPAGNAYGMASSSAGPSIFELGKGVLNWLYTFTGGADGSFSSPLVFGPDRTLYGVSNGGIQNCNGSYCSQVLNLKPGPTACISGLCPWWETELYRFTGTNDAYDPRTLVFDQAGNLYGISEGGGPQGKGAVFQLAPSGSGWTENIIHNFTGGSDGADPWALLLGVDGNLYGTTGAGGKYGSGTFFELSPSAGGWTFADLYDFQGSSLWGMTRDGWGNFYGLDGGDTVSMLSPSNGGWTLTPLYSIVWYEHGIPLGLVWAHGGLDGATYGTCSGQVHGEVFTIFQGSYYTLHTFEYWSPNYLTTDPGGTMWGTSWDGGEHCFGAIWRY